MKVVLTLWPLEKAQVPQKFMVLSLSSADLDVSMHIQKSSECFLSSREHNPV